MTGASTWRWSRPTRWSAGTAWLASVLTLEGTGPEGRPPLRPERPALIARLSQEHPLWGSERCSGELLQRGIVVRNRSIRCSRWQRPARPTGTTWRTFLANHIHAIWGRAATGRTAACATNDCCLPVPWLV